MIFYKQIQNCCLKYGPKRIKQNRKERNFFFAPFLKDKCTNSLAKNFFFSFSLSDVINFESYTPFVVFIKTWHKSSLVSSWVNLLISGKSFYFILILFRSWFFVPLFFFFNLEVDSKTYTKFHKLKRPLPLSLKNIIFILLFICSLFYCQKGMFQIIDWFLSSGIFL